jgi:putative transcription antitermination factor YqgF
MIFLGIDYGTKNIGLAISDEEGRFAVDIPILKHNPQSVLTSLKDICEQRRVEAIIIGIPGLDRENDMTSQIRTFALNLAAITKIKVDFWDESFSSINAEMGLRGKRLKSSDSRAARMILQEYLDFKYNKQL